MEGKNQASYVQKDGVIKPPTGQEGKQEEKKGKGVKKALVATAAVTCGLAVAAAAAYKIGRASCRERV